MPAEVGNDALVVVEAQEIVDQFDGGDLGVGGGRGEPAAAEPGRGRLAAQVAGPDEHARDQLVEGRGGTSGAEVS